VPGGVHGRREKIRNDVPPGSPSRGRNVCAHVDLWLAYAVAPLEGTGDRSITRAGRRRLINNSYITSCRADRCRRAGRSRRGPAAAAAAANPRRTQNESFVDYDDNGLPPIHYACTISYINCIYIYAAVACNNGSRGVGLKNDYGGGRARRRRRVFISGPEMCK